MKILFSHLKKFLLDDLDIEDVSNSLFRLGHEHEIHNEIFDIEFTPNKGDCLSVFGLARDLNALHKVNLKIDIFEDHINKFNFSFKNDLPDFCKSISFMKIEIDSPTDIYKDYLENYFKKLNINKNNFFSDISNYVAYEIGQPTHCYDFNDVKDGLKLSLNDKESSFKTLTSKVINLMKGERVFIQNNEVVNFAGVMGGDNTKCKSDTNICVVECAFFNPDMIIGKSVKYDLVSDAAYKFERGTDPKIHDFALRRFIKIVDDHAIIKSISIQTNNYKECKEKSIERDYKRINRILGTNFEDKYIDKILQKLGFSIFDEFQVPSWRSDIETVNDLAEEIARVHGYNNIKNSKINISKDVVRNIDSKINKIRSFMINNNFNEIINDPFVRNHSSSSVKVDNPLDSNREFLRTNLIESLIHNLDYNEKRQKDSIKLFEISDIYEKNNIIEPKKVFSLIISGRRGLNYKIFNQKLDKSYLIELIKKIGLDKTYIKEVPRDSLKSKIKHKIFYVECDITNIDENLIPDMIVNYNDIKFNKFKNISDLPSSIRDISISFSTETILEDVIELVFKIELKNIKDTFIFDFYHNKDKNILKVGFRFIFQSSLKTLEESEIDTEMNKVFESLHKIKGVEIPGLNH